MARPPLLCQGGDFAFPAGCPRRPCPADDLWVTLKHHCKEGWPSDSENIAKHPLIARPGWFSDESKRKTTPALSQLIHTFGLVSPRNLFGMRFETLISNDHAVCAFKVAPPHFLDGAATP